MASGVESGEHRASESATMKRKLQKDFFERRLSILGLARKYGKTCAQIEEMLRW
jgi:hypothetical protein